jgi:hypothetical protein
MEASGAVAHNRKVVAMAETLKSALTISPGWGELGAILRPNVRDERLDSGYLGKSSRLKG